MRKGTRHSPEAIEKMRLIKLGKKHTEEWKKQNGLRNTGKKSPVWKGESVHYTSLHKWVSRWKGSPTKCEICKTDKKIKYHWANKDHKYKRDLNDYESLCVKCHRLKDLGGLKPWNYGKKLHYPVWNKGIKTGLVPKTAWKKGYTPKGSILYKKGHTPWNKKII